MLSAELCAKHLGPRKVTWLDNLVTGGTLAPVSDRNSHSLPSDGSEEASPQTALCRRGVPRLRPALLLLVLESWRAVRLVADRFFHSHSDRPYPAESDPKCIPFSAGARPGLSSIITGERHGRVPDSKVHAFAGGFRGSGGSPGLLQKGRKIITHTKDPSWICPSSGTSPLRCPSIVATPSLLINESWWTRRLSLAINTGPSEKIHSQIRRPSFSDSLLTRIRWRSLAQLKNVFRAPIVHFHAPAVFQIRKCFRHPVKIRSVGQTISFARRRRERGAGAHHSVCRGRSVSRLSPGPSL